MPTTGGFVVPGLTQPHVDNFPVATARRPTISDMPRRQSNENFGLDANGCLTERIVTEGQEVIIHYDDVPESDITLINGIRCTTALRTVIDIAPELDRAEFEKIVRDCLHRKLFTPDEAMKRVSQPDMLTRPGARLLRQIISRS